MNPSGVQTSPDRQRAECGDGVLARAMLGLFECEQPATLAGALALVAPDLRPATEVFDAVADAWERYRHIKDMPWD